MSGGDLPTLVTRVGSEPVRADHLQRPDGGQSRPARAAVGTSGHCISRTHDRGLKKRRGFLGRDRCELVFPASEEPFPDIGGGVGLLVRELGHESFRFVVADVCEGLDP